MPVFPWISLDAAVPQQMPVLARMFKDVLTFAAHDPVDPKNDLALLITAPVLATPIAKTVLPLRFQFKLPSADAVNLEAAPAAQPIAELGVDTFGAQDSIDTKNQPAFLAAAAVPEPPVAGTVLPPCFQFATPDVLSFTNHSSAGPPIAVPGTRGSRFARPTRVEAEEEKPEAIAATIANQAPVMLLPNLEATAVPQSVAKQTEAPLPPPANPTVQAEVGTLSSGELAFAAKLMPTVVTELRETPAPAAKNPEPAPALKPESPAYRVAAPEAVPSIQSVAQPHGQTAEPEHKTETREIPRPLEVPPEVTPSKPAEGLRDISFRLVDGSKEQVEVRLLERAGELRVSVRSADPQLNTELRNGLGDLAGKLEKTGFHTETWHPANEHARSGEAAQTGNSKQEQEPRHHAGQQHPERRDARGIRKIRPRWVEEISRNFAIGDESR